MPLEALGEPPQTAQATCANFKSRCTFVPCQARSSARMKCGNTAQNEQRVSGKAKIERLVVE